MYLFTIPGFFLCTSLMCPASLSFLIAMSLMFTAVSLVLIFIASSVSSAMISLIFSVVYLICIPVSSLNVIANLLVFAVIPFPLKFQVRSLGRCLDCCGGLWWLVVWLLPTPHASNQKLHDFS